MVIRVPQCKGVSSETFPNVLGRSCPEGSQEKAAHKSFLCRAPSSDGGSAPGLFSAAGNPASLGLERASELP